MRIKKNNSIALFIILSVCFINSTFAKYRPDFGKMEAIKRKTEAGKRVRQAIIEVKRNTADACAVKDVTEGKISVANAAWWGFDPVDSTAALQDCIDSGAKTVLIPNMGIPWIISETIQLVSNQTILIENGTVLQAKKDEFKNIGESLIVGIGVNNIEIIGYDAVLRMNKKDYQSDKYLQFETRHIFNLMGCKNVKIAGLSLIESGGDGIILGDFGIPPAIRDKSVTCEDIIIQDIQSIGNHRQGLSIESAKNLLVDNCSFRDTSGTAPADGIDLEPFGVKGRVLDNIVIRNCELLRNEGGALTVNQGKMDIVSAPEVNVLFENCRFADSKQNLVWITVIYDNPNGLIEFKDCLIENCDESGIWVSHKSSKGTKVKFTDCTLKNVAKSWQNTEDKGYDDYEKADPNNWKGKQIWPIYIYSAHNEVAKTLGGVEFNNVYIEDNFNRPVLVFMENGTNYGIEDVSGIIYVDSPYEPYLRLGDKLNNVNVVVKKMPPVIKE